MRHGEDLLKNIYIYIYSQQTQTMWKCQFYDAEEEETVRSFASVLQSAQDDEEYETSTSSEQVSQNLGEKSAPACLRLASRRFTTNVCFAGTRRG